MAAVLCSTAPTDDISIYLLCGLRWSKGRCVTSLDYCPQHPELLACSYNNNEDLPHEPDGVVLVWNTKFKKTTPEYIFHCQSRVVSTTFAKFHPNLLLGGTYSGQICLWDNRHNKRTPVQKSPLSTAAHTHPVYCIKVVGKIFVLYRYGTIKILFIALYFEIVSMTTVFRNSKRPQLDIYIN